MLRFVVIAGLSLALASPIEAEPAATYTVAVANFSFSPHPIRLVAGRPVTLVFANRSGSGHDFTAKRFFASSRIISGSAPGGEIELGGHETRTITLVPAAGTYKAHCSHFLHSTMGMTDSIIVS
jgi:plastocyanin